MSKTRNGKLSEKQLQRSWKGTIDTSSTHLASNVGQKNQQFITVNVRNGEELVKKLIKLTQVTRVSQQGHPDHFDFNADDFSNDNETIHGSGYWTVHLADEKVDAIEFFAHSVSLSDPRQAHDMAK